MQVRTILSVAALSAAVAAQGYVQLDFEKRVPADSPLSKRLGRRQNTPVYAPIYQNTNKLEYIINVTVGSPGQNLGVTFDTGSSDLWIPTTTFCDRKTKDKKCDLGSFDPSKSSTYQTVLPGQFNITYVGPGDSDAGDWAAESVSIGGGQTITNQIFGAATAGFDQHGVIGFGFDTNEAEPNPSSTNVYKSVLDNLVGESIIARKAYSLYLNSLNETVGSVILGGVDSTKYTGPLVALPMQKSSADATSVTEFYVTLTQVVFTDAVGAAQVLTPSGYAQSVLLDSGTSQTLLDAPTVGRLVNGLGGVDLGQASYVVPCGYAKTNATVSYTFGGSNGVTVVVPVSELIGNQEGNECDLGYGPPAGDGSVIFGDTFLRSAYIVLDLDNKVAAVAQAVDGKASMSSIVAIPTGTRIPGASVTATISGTQLSGLAATSTPAVPTASFGKHSSILAGTPTFNLGAAATSAASASASSANAAAAAFATGKTPAIVLGAGLALGALAF